MRLTAWLMFAALLSPSAAVAQQDSSFKNVEYLSGANALQEKQKGTLVVSAADVRLIDKKGQPILTVPLAAIRAVTDSVVVKESKKSALSADGGGGIGAVKGLFGKKGPEQRIVISTEKDSVKETIVFKTHEKEAGARIASKIRAQLGWPDPAAERAKKTAAKDAPKDAGSPPADDTTSAPPPLMIVANPFAAEPADSAAAVEVGTVVRDEISAFVGDKFQVVTRKQMNMALEPYGYPADAILSQSLAVTLAKELQAQVIITGDMKKGSDGNYTVTTSLATVDSPTGNPVTVTQNAGESLADFGHRVAEALKGPKEEPASTP